MRGWLRFPAFLPEAVVGLHAFITVLWMKGWPLSSIIRERIRYLDQRKRPYKLPQLIRSTMELIEQIARFRAPKYVSAYLSVLKIYLAENGKLDLLSDGLDFSVSMEFGLSSITMVSLTELGLSRMSAVAIYDKMAVDSLTRQGCLDWLADYSDRLFDIGIPALVIEELQRKIPYMRFTMPLMSDDEFERGEDDT